jgi:hypothetical protein
MAISPALLGISLILALLDEEGYLLEGAINDSGYRKGNEAEFYLTGQVVAAYRSRERFQTVPYKEIACLIGR